MAKKKKSYKFLSKMKKRLLFVVVAFSAVFVVLISRLIYINAKEGAKYEQQVLAQQGYSSTVIPYRRGDILDSNGTTLATTKKVYNLILEPKNILEKEEYTTATVEALKTYFSFTDAEISEFLSNKDSYYEIALKDLEYEQVKPFNDFYASEDADNVRGVYFEEEYERIYPNNDLACHLIGFTVSGNVGMYGIEENYNSYLNGYNGRQYSYLNEEYGLTETIEPAVNGYNLITSIDANIQSIVQEKVEEYMTTGEGAKNVSVLVMDPATCDILALYNSHQFDPNDAYDLDSLEYQFETVEEFEDFKKNASDEETVAALNQVWRNFAISDVFEPGSTYKTFTIAGALEEGIVTENSTFMCDGGEQVEDYYINCHSHDYGGHGEVTLSRALEGSCNDAMMAIADAEGASIFDKYQVLFGFGQPTGIDIPGEPDSLSFSTVVYHEDTLNPVELATSSFGQGVCVSMIQVGTAFCSTINGGYYYEPSVVDRIEDEDGNIIDTLDNVLVRRTVSESVSAIMRQELFQVVEEGTGKKAGVEGYTIGGKTGTAEKLPRGNQKYLLSFIGFAPVDNPQVVIYVVVDEPDIEVQSSSSGATLLFSAIAGELFPYMNIYKTNDNYDLDISDAVDQPAVPIYTGDTPDGDVAGGDDNPYVSDSDDEPVQDDSSGDGGTGDDGTGDDSSGDDTGDVAGGDDDSGDDDSGEPETSDEPIE